MSDNKLENKIKEYAGEIFGREIELPSGHRERFKQRLKRLHTGCEAGRQEEAGCTAGVKNNASATTATETEQKSGAVVSLKRWLIASVAAAAVIAGFIFRLKPSVVDSQPNREDVCNYYNMQLEEQVDATRQLLHHVDEAHREVLLADVERIENEPLPDVQLMDDEYIVLIAGIYTSKIETLQNLQNIIRENI
jgi:hypothetical protein